MYGKNDLRLEEFDLPALGDDEILAHVVSDSICLSSYKSAKQGSEHKRVPSDIAERPVMIGHEFCGEIVEVGPKWRGRFSAGQKFSIQPALNYKGSLAAPGYSYRYIGGDATYVIIPSEVMEVGCLLAYEGEPYFLGSLAEPMSCIIGAFNAMYHTTPGSYRHEMGVVPGGRMAILAGAGPMGLGAIDYALHFPSRPRLLVVTDIDQARLDRATKLFSPQHAATLGVDLRYVNTATAESSDEEMLDLTDGEGFDDIFVLAMVPAVVESGDRILGRDGCLHFFAGPTNPDFSVTLNFYRLHYSSTHFVGTSGGTTEDMADALRLMGEGTIDPSAMVTHVGGLDAVADTTLRLPEIPGGKKLIYTNVSLPLVALEDLGKSDDSALLRELGEIVSAHDGLWSLQAEQHLLQNAPPI